jgi:hypothetical protein
MPETVSAVEPQFRHPIRALDIRHWSLVPERPQVRSVTIDLSQIPSITARPTFFAGTILGDFTGARLTNPWSGSWLTDSALISSEYGLSSCHYFPLSGDTSLHEPSRLAINNLIVMPVAQHTELLTDLIKVIKKIKRYDYRVMHNYIDYTFRMLLEQWYKETEYTSSFTRIVMSSPYQRIIGMGPEVVPLILRQIESEGDDPAHWGWALSSITGEDPVPDKAAGDTVKIAEAWLSWGRSRYAW